MLLNINNFPGTKPYTRIELGSLIIVLELRDYLPALYED